MGLIRLARGGVRAGSCAFPASHRLLGHPCECSQVLAQHSKPNALPVPSSPRFVKCPFRSRRVPFLLKIWTPFFGPKAVSHRKTHGFWRVRVWSCFSKGPQQTHWCALSPFGLPRATFKATMQNTALRRHWRSVGGPFGPKWAWHSRRVHIFKKRVFICFWVRF